MKKRYGMVIDLERCTGCRACTVACKIENSMEHGTGIRVETVGGAKQDTPGGEYPELSMGFLPVACMHCERPPSLPRRLSNPGNLPAVRWRCAD